MHRDKIRSPQASSSQMLGKALHKASQNALKVSMNKLHLLFLCSSFILAACGKSPTDIVKKSYIDEARTTTVANGLSQRALCKSTQWETFKDDKKRDLVQYKCTIVDGHDFLKEKRDENLKKAIKDAELELAYAIKSRDDTKQKIADDYPTERDAIEQSQRRIDKIQSLEKVGLRERDWISNIQATKDHFESILKTRRQDAQKQLAAAEQRITQAQKRNVPKDIEKSITARHPIYTDTAEIFQWIVNGEGQAILTYGEIQALDDKGQEKTIMKYNRPDPMLSFAAQAQQKSILEYMNAIGMGAFIGAFGR